MRSNIHKQAGKVCTYMQTSLCLFIPFLSSGIHDPRPFQNNTDLTCALFLTSSSTSFSHFPSSVVLLHIIIFMSSLSFSCVFPIFFISSSSLSCEVVQLITMVQSCVVLALSATHLPHLLPSSVHPPTPSLFPPLH